MIDRLEFSVESIQIGVAQGGVASSPSNVEGEMGGTVDEITMFMAIWTSLVELAWILITGPNLNFLTYG